MKATASPIFVRIVKSSYRIFVPPLRHGLPSAISAFEFFEVINAMQCPKVFGKFRKRAVMRRLMSHLAQFSSISKQGEFLCTQGLAYLLQNPDARGRFADHISKLVHRTVSSDLNWRTEVRQQDGGRCDLQASADGSPLIKIEAKLDAPFGKGQLSSYVADLQKWPGNGLLLVLVPRRRAEETIASMSNTFALTGSGPWQLRDPRDCLVAVIYWEEVLESLGVVGSEPFSSDLAQFHAMYRVLNGYDIEPITSDSELLKWREKEGAFMSLVDRSTRRLTQHHQVLPFGYEGEPNSYQRRYICRPPGTEQSCFSVGVRDPFVGHMTPIWLRFHRDTPKYSVIRDRLFASSLSQRLIESGGHIWIPLDVPLKVDGERQIDSLVEQAKRIIEVAYQPQ